MDDRVAAQAALVVEWAADVLCARFRDVCVELVGSLRRQEESLRMLKRRGTGGQSNSSRVATQLAVDVAAVLGGLGKLGVRCEELLSAESLQAAVRE